MTAVKKATLDEKPAFDEKPAPGGDIRQHPYGVEPMGNIFLKGATNCRPQGLGTLHAFSDQFMLGLMECLGVLDLCRVASSSRALYVFAHVDEVWKALVIKEMSRRPGESLKTRGRWWKSTMSALRVPEFAGPPHVPLKVSGFFSDLLFQPHLCSTVPIRREWLSKTNVDRRSGISPAAFREEYEVPNIPVVLVDGAASWPAISCWTKEHLLKCYGDLRLHAGGLEFELKDYLRYAEESEDELPLYVFDKHFANKCPALGEGYSVPEVFPDDLFSVLDENDACGGADDDDRSEALGRPDYRWLIAGPARSGSSFHVDPNGTSAWNGVVCGRKKWVLFPPGATPPGVFPSEDGLDLAAPVSITEWFLNFYEDCHSSGCQVRPLECVVSAGEVLFVPRGWWHCVLNLEWSVAITQNFVSRVNLPHVVRFLSEKKHLISGLPLEKRENLGERFLAALSKQRPDMAFLASRSTCPGAGGGQGEAVGASVGKAVVHGASRGKSGGGLWRALKKGQGGSLPRDDQGESGVTDISRTQKRHRKEPKIEPKVADGEREGGGEGENGTTEPERFCFGFSFP
ncbi:unnamed protein product [Discosporangium mesarthrocarpum]